MMTLGTGANRDLTITEKTPSILCPFLILLADKPCIATRYKRIKKFLYFIFLNAKKMS